MAQLVSGTERTRFHKIPTLKPIWCARKTPCSVPTPENTLRRPCGRPKERELFRLHTPKYPSRSTNEGFFAQDVGWGAWGAMAYILPNASARALSPGFARREPPEQRSQGRIGKRGLSGRKLVSAGRVLIPHACPSLCEHTGATSTLWEKASLRGKRASADFPGDEFDARDCL